ncbi:transposase [Stigmatella aurantiaca]|uniref:Transposase n=1 Tax=Stigmatella aurantiaca TaxID=41 RepID=A0A1H8CMC6_STIAU|nr:transposase [Stigmatella aurantiaca]SEM95227.1 transposase [Stigmatella aurantiaca]
MERRKRRKFTEQFKAEAVKLARESGKSLRKISPCPVVTGSGLS